MLINDIAVIDGLVESAESCVILGAWKRICAALEKVAHSTAHNTASNEIAALKSAVESLRSDLSSLRGKFHDFVQLHERVDGFDDDI